MESRACRIMRRDRLCMRMASVGGALNSHGAWQRKYLSLSSSEFLVVYKSAAALFRKQPPPFFKHVIIVQAPVIYICTCHPSHQLILKQKRHQSLWSMQKYPPCANIKNANKNHDFLPLPLSVRALYFVLASGLRGGIFSPRFSISFCLDSLTSSGRPHHSRMNSSWAAAILVFLSRCRCRSIRSANHSSRAASCSSCVARSFMQAFIAVCSARQANVTLNVRPRAQSANAVWLLLANGFCDSSEGG